MYVAHARMSEQCPTLMHNKQVELPALHPDRVRVLGLVLDGHRVRAGEDQPRGRHVARHVVSSWTRYVGQSGHYS